MPLKLVTTTPKKSLNAAFLKVRPLRSEIDIFKLNLINLLDKIDILEQEQNQKTHVRDFLINTYYKGKNEVNTKGNIDLVIHTDNTNKSTVGVIIEAKRPSNKAEWITADKPNGKALQECVLYYLRERIDEQNIYIKNIIITNIHEWYIIDAVWFEKFFYGNHKLVKEYKDWCNKTTTAPNTAFFYNEIAAKHIDSIDESIPCTTLISDHTKRHSAIPILAMTKNSSNSRSYFQSFTYSKYLLLMIVINSINDSIQSSCTS